MSKGTLFIAYTSDMESIVTLLTRNGYTVQVEETEALDCFCTEYRVKFKRKDENSEP